MSTHTHHLTWRKQVIRDLNDINPYLFGVIMIVLSSTFVGSLGMSLLMNLGWPFVGMLVLLLGMLTVALCAAIWVAGKMPDGVAPVNESPRAFIVDGNTYRPDDVQIVWNTARFGVLQVAQ
jgi:hypothetical protein